MGMRGLWVMVLCCVVGNVCAGERPDILLFMADDMTYTDLGCFGNSEVVTPSLDRLASRGMKLTEMFTPAPTCSPLRQALYTGIYPVRNGAHPNHARVYDGVKSLAHYLGALGYRVGQVGKRHEAPQSAFPVEFLGGKHGDNGEGLDLDLDLAAEFIGGDARDKDEPYCLVVTSNQPHTPWNRGDASAYDADALTLPTYMADTPVTRKWMTDYYAEITYMDQQVGRCMELVEATGKETLFLFLSEQGSNFPHCKWTCYDTGMKGAGIVWWAGVAPGSESDALMQYVDVVPTFVEVAGGDPEDKSTYDFDGRSFLGVLKGEVKEHRDYVFGVQTSRGIAAGPEGYGIRAVRDRRYKYIWNLNAPGLFRNTVVAKFPPFQDWKRAAAEGDARAQFLVKGYIDRPTEEFYDLKTDPFELRNLAGEAQYRSRMDTMKVALLAWMKQQGDEGLATEMAAMERQVSGKDHWGKDGKE